MNNNIVYILSKLEENRERDIKVKDSFHVEHGYAIIDPTYALSDEMYEEYMHQVGDGLVEGLYKHGDKPYMLLATTGADGVYLDNYSEEKVSLETASLAVIDLDFVKPTKKELEDKNVLFIWVDNYCGDIGLYQDNEIIFIDEFTEQEDRPNRICNNFLFTALMYNPLKESQEKCLTKSDNKIECNDKNLQESLMNKDYEKGKPYCVLSNDDFKKVHDDSMNIVYHGWQKWVQSRNPEPDKLHNLFAKAEKSGIFYSGVINLD